MQLDSAYRLSNYTIKISLDGMRTKFAKRPNKHTDYIIRPNDRIRTSVTDR